MMTRRRLLSTTGLNGLVSRASRASWARMVSGAAMNGKPFWFGAGPLGNAGVLVRLGAIGAVMLSVAGAFAYVGGWLSPVRLTQDRMLAAFQEANGTHAGFRRNHAKGVCVTGWVASNGAGAG